MPPRISELTRAFEAGTLDPSKFSHADHVAVAYNMLNVYDFLEASSRYAATIRALADKAGAPRKFNTTVTVAFLSLIAERMAKGQYVSYDDFIADNADLTSRKVLEAWYSSARLDCDMARTIFLLPDPCPSPQP